MNESETKLFMQKGGKVDIIYLSYNTFAIELFIITFKI